MINLREVEERCKARGFEHMLGVIVGTDLPEAVRLLRRSIRVIGQLSKRSPYSEYMSGNKLQE